MGEVRLIPLGVGEAFSERHYTTCLALNSGDDWLLLDCPHPLRKMIREASDTSGIPFGSKDFRGVVLSHLHADHSTGLEDYAYYSYFVLQKKATLLAHPIVADRVWPNLLAAGMDQAGATLDAPPDPKAREDYFHVIELDEAKAVDFGPFSIECRQTIHSIPTTAFRITTAGRTLGFSADTAYDPSLIDWLAPCDLIVHEATLQQSSPLHTPYHHLAALPAPLRRKMRLIHYPDNIDAVSPNIEPLLQGRCYPV